MRLSSGSSAKASRLSWIRCSWWSKPLNPRSKSPRRSRAPWCVCSNRSVRSSMWMRPSSSCEPPPRRPRRPRLVQKPPRRIQPVPPQLSSPPNPARERANTWWAGAKCPSSQVAPVPHCRQNPQKLKAARPVRVPKFRPPCAGSPAPSGSI